MKKKRVLSQEEEFAYSGIKMSDGNIIMYNDNQCCKDMNLCRNKQIQYDILTFSHCFFGNTNSGTPFADNIANVSGKRKPERENKAAQPQTKQIINK